MNEQRGCHRFDGFELDGRTLELRAAGRAVPLEPLPARLLVRLVEHAGEMVPRRDLLELGWPRLPDAAHDSLNTCIRQIREALGDDARAPRFVETLRGRGYRFIGSLEAEHAATHRVSPVRAGRLALLTAACLTILATYALRGRDAAQPDPALRDGLARTQWILENGRDPARALALADTLAATYPTAAAAHAIRAELRLFVGDFEGARVSAAHTLTLEPRHAVARRVTAHLFAFAGDWPRADRAMATALETDPEDARSWLAHAFLLTVRGRFDDADAAMRRARTLDPRSPLVHGDIGLMYLYASRWDDAIGACADMLAAEPEAAWALDCLFDAHLLAGRHADAETWAGRILANAGDTVTAGAIAAVRAHRIEDARAVGLPSYGLALAFADAGRREEALDALERAALAPGFGVLTVAVEPRFATLRDEARFRRLVARFGLDAARR